MISSTCYFWLLTAATVTRSILADTPSPKWTVYHSWDGGQQYSRRGILEWNGDEFILQNDEFTKEQATAMLDFGWYQNQD